MYCMLILNIYLTWATEMTIYVIYFKSSFFFLKDAGIFLFII